MVKVKLFESVVRMDGIEKFEQRNILQALKIWELRITEKAAASIHD